MADQSFEIFVHGQGTKPVIAPVIPTDTLKEVLIRVAVIEEGGNDLLVFVGECDEALAEPRDTEDGRDEHNPIDVSLTLELLELERHRHVHCHRCRHVVATVNYGAKTKHRRFSPATTIGVVTQWARNKFDLDPAAAAEYVLRLCNSIEQPRPDKHLGELVEAPGCSICFDLVNEVTPQG
jgi:hypothetical protein